MNQLNIGVAQATPTHLEIGEVITTQRNGLTGIVKEVVPNRTGTYRVRYQHPTLGMLWTTYDPRRGEGN
jgi:hypothetical protein